MNSVERLERLGTVVVLPASSWTESAQAPTADKP